MIFTSVFSDMKTIQNQPIILLWFETLIIMDERLLTYFSDPKENKENK